jgi:thiamine-monophosphate kinase
MGEFELIKRYFTRATPRAALGVGDDCALLVPRPGMQMAISSDMLVEGRHFFPDVNPRTLGHKALAVNLSDLAACGARPLAFTLALALPSADEAWLAPFSLGLLALADVHGCELIGGDTTRGPLNICITVFGEVPPGQALLRSGASAGDDIYVSGHLGEARLALEHRLGNLHLDDTTLKRCVARMDSPQPRVSLGLALRGIASAAADVSDGLLGDLGHILERSGTGATLETVLACTLLPDPPRALESSLQFVLAGGDDYELVFTAPPTSRDAVSRAAQESGTAVTRIGVIDAAPGLRLRDAIGALVPNTYASFDHFAP